MGEHKFKEMGDLDETSTVSISEPRLAAMLGANQVEDVLSEILMRGEAPKGLQARQMQAMMLLRHRKLDEAEKMIEDLCRRSQDQLSYKMSGDVKFLKCDYEGAEKWYLKVLEKDPTNADVLHDAGVAIVSQGRIEESYPYFRRAIAYNPQNAQFKHHLSIMLLLGGHDVEGWNMMEERMNVPGVTGTYPFPERYWRGQSVKGKHIVLRTEQGFGDTIQFMRYAKRIHEMGAAKITAYCQPAMWQYIEKRYPYVTGCPNVTPPPLDVDYHVNLMSLGLRFLGDYCTEPATEDPERDGIGVCWFGSPTHLADHLRTVALENFQKLQEKFPGEKWVIAAYGRFDKEMPPGFSYYIDDCRDWHETAQKIKKLKLVITVDTAIGHMAASLGVPTWILTSYVPDFRWRFNGGMMTPWYESMRLYRQPKLFDWQSVFDRVETDLAEFLANKPSSLIGQQAAKVA